MSWKYSNNKQQIKQYREQMTYVPFTFRDQTHCSPFYRFQTKLNPIHSPKSIPLDFKGDEIFKQESIRLNKLSEESKKSSKSNRSLSSPSDSGDELKSEEVLEIMKRVNAKGRRKAIFHHFQFGLQLEDIFNNNLSSIAKNMNEDQRSPGKTSFQFNNVRSGLLDEIDQVKGMIDIHRNSQNNLQSNHNLDQDQINSHHLNSQNSQNSQNNQHNQNKLNNTQDKGINKENQSQKQNKNNSSQNKKIQVQKSELDLSIKGVSPKKKQEQKEVEVEGQEDDQSKADQTKLQQKGEQEQKLEEEEEEDNLQVDNLNDYLNQVIIKRGNNKKKGLRQIFILYKKFKGNFYSIQIEKFFIPIYTQIVDNLELLSDFLYWKDYLSKWMKMRGKPIDHIFTSNGFKILNLNQVQTYENILIIQEEDGQLQLWHDFQTYHNLQLTMPKQKYFANYLNNLQSREEIYKSLITSSILSKILQGYNDERTLNTTQMNQSKTHKATQNKAFFLPSINHKQTTKDSIIEVDQNTINENENQERKIAQNNKMRRKQKSTIELAISPQLTQFQRDKLDLVDLYSQYQNIMISSLGKKIKYPNKSPSISTGALLKQFNGVKMKVLQQSFPYLAQKKEVEARLEHSSYKPQQIQF